MVGVKMKKILLVKTAGSVVSPTLVGLYLPTRMDVEAATVAVEVEVEVEVEVDDEEDDDAELLVDDEVAAGP
jgi:hypothetical protein